MHFLLTILSETPPKPDITYGEFSLRLEYKINNELIIHEDILIAEFSGINHFSVNGKHRQWRQHLMSDRRSEHILLMTLENGGRLYYNVGSASYFMGDVIREESTQINSFNSVFLQDGNSRRLILPDVLLSDFGIELISWEHDPPIENVFR